MSAVLQGCQKAVPATSKINVNGAVVTVAQVISVLAGYLPVFQAVRDAQTAYKNALASRRQAMPGIQAYLRDLKKALEALLGSRNPVLAQFGYSVVQKRQLTAAQKAVATEKRKLTRQKRGTMGKRQKATIVAETPSVNIDPSGQVSATSPAGGATAAAEASPAPAGSNSGGSPVGSGSTGSGK